MNKNWSHARKQQARQDTIIDAYPFGPVQQYWSMAGLCDKPGCEVDQIVRSGLCRFDQFHGVEINSAVHRANRAAFPEAHWYNADFYRVLSRAQARRKFRPSIVNADLIQMPSAGAAEIGKIMLLLSDYQDVMLVANFVLEARHHEFQEPESVIRALERCHTFKMAWPRGWELAGNPYIYEGTGDKSKTTMGTFIFLRPAQVAVAA